MSDSPAVPASLVTPDAVKTSSGTFVFEDGLPPRDTVEAVYGQLDRTPCTSSRSSTSPPGPVVVDGKTRARAAIP